MTWLHQLALVVNVKMTSHHSAPAISVKAPQPDVIEAADRAAYRKLLAQRQLQAQSFRTAPGTLVRSSSAARVGPRPLSLGCSDRSLYRLRNDDICTSHSSLLGSIYRSTLHWWLQLVGRWRLGCDSYRGSADQGLSQVNLQCSDICAEAKVFFWAMSVDLNSDPSVSLQQLP